MAIDVKIPVIGESVEEATLASWSVADGDVVEEGDIICEIESDKASLELPAEVGGRISLIAKEGDDLAIGSVIAAIDEMAAGEAKSEAAPAEPNPAPIAETPTNTSQTQIASPAAKKIIAEKNLDASQIAGSGKDGRITKADALNAPAPSTQAKTEPNAPAEKAASPQTLVSSFGTREVTREKMSRLRKTIAKRLTEAKNSTAMLTTFNEVNMQPIMQLRKKYQDDFVKQHDIKLGFMSLFTKACCLAMKKHPLVNAQIDGEELVIPHYVDMGIAVSSDKGLVVPVLRNAESMGLAEIEKEIKRLAAKARDGKITLDEMSGGSFTITNGGIFGSMLSTPILNIPQSAILGMHNIVERPWVVDGEIKICPIMYVALSYDHRVIDGKDSVGFLKTVKDLLEDPARMILDL